MRAHGPYYSTVVPATLSVRLVRSHKEFSLPPRISHESWISDAGLLVPVGKPGVRRCEP